MPLKINQLFIVIYGEQTNFAALVRSNITENIECYQDLSPCISSIERKRKGHETILITTLCDENTLKSFQSLEAVRAILILSTNVRNIETLPSKVIGCYSQMEKLITACSELIDSIEFQLKTNSILTSTQDDGSDNFDFYFYCFLKKYINNSKSTKASFLEQARILFQSNNHMQKLIDDFKKLYKPSEALIWLNKSHRPFPYYHLIVHALCANNKEILRSAQFFFNDINKHMKTPSARSADDEAYIGTKLSIDIIKRLEQCINKDIITFPCYLNATRSRMNALHAATKHEYHQNTSNVLFKFDLKTIRYITMGDSILIEMATHFRVSLITKGTSGNSGQPLFILKLRGLTKNESEQLLQQFIDRQKSLGKSLNDLMLHFGITIDNDEALADEHIKGGEWLQAANILTRIRKPNVSVLNKLGCLFREHLDNINGALECHKKALAKAMDRERTETLIYLGLTYKSLKRHAESFHMYEQALQWLEKQTTKDFDRIARCLVGLGNAKWGQRQLSEALTHMKRALEIRECHVKPKNNFDVAACFNNIGNILRDQGDIQNALKNAQCAVDILLTCTQTDPHLGAAYNNLGAIHLANRDFNKARECFELALKLLPNENHPFRKSTLINIAHLNELGKSKK